MTWKTHTDDGFVDVVLDLNYNGDLLDLARFRPHNRPIIDAAWEKGKSLDLYEITRCKLLDPNNPLVNFWDTLSELEEHYGPYRG